MSAILFLYRHVLDDPLPWLGDVVRAHKPRRLPVVLTRDEVRAILGEMSGVPWLVASLLYGTGMRLMEGLRLRVKDIDFIPRIIIVREGKGDKDRRTMLPKPLIQLLEQQLEGVRRVHEKDMFLSLNYPEPLRVVHLIASGVSPLT